jgi:hypothetical protein
MIILGIEYSTAKFSFSKPVSIYYILHKNDEVRENIRIQVKVSVSNLTKNKS